MSTISTNNYQLIQDTGSTQTKIIFSLILISVILLSFIYSTPILANENRSRCDLALNITQKSNTDYIFTIKNNGLRMCRNTSVSVYFPENLSYVSSNPKTTSSDYYWNLGNINSNGEKVISLVTKYKATNSTTVNLEACVASNNGRDACSSLESSIILPIIKPVITTPTFPTPPTVNSSTTLTDSGSSEYGTWVWESPYGMSDSYMNKVISGSVANKINVIYLTIDDYLNIYNLPEGPSKEVEKVKYSDSLEKFILAANKANIQVDVEAGWRDWAEAPNTYKGKAIIDYAIEYNSLRKNKIRGVQFDVEPYLLPTYETNKAVILKNFVAFVDTSTKILGSNELRLNIVIPHFYDSTQQWTPSFTYGGITTHAFDHILRILDTRPKSSITLMSYRNFSLGSNGTVEISKAEVDQASEGTHPTKIIVAQETGNVAPGYVTFYNLSKAEYEKQISIIKNTFANRKNFGGIAVHYIDPFLLLK